MAFPPRAALLLAVALMFAGCLGAEPDPAGGDAASFPESGDEAVAVAWGEVATATIRPGASMNGYCTYNWLFSNDQGQAFIGTAGHCTDELGELVALGNADPETDSIGFVVFDSDLTSGADVVVDFALIELHGARISEAHPTMLGWNGPSGWVGPGDAAAGDLVGLHGYGTFLGDQDETRDRTGVLLSADEREYVANMPAVPGDSGAPLIHVESGKALGIISRFNIDGIPPSTDIGPTMAFILAELEKAGFAVQLATA